MDDNLPRLGQQRPGLTVARYVRALAQPGGWGAVISFAEKQAQWRDRDIVVDALKSSIDAMDRDSMEAATSAIGADLVAVVRPLSLVGRMQGIRQAPFRTRMILGNTGASAAFVGEGAPIPLSAADFDSQGQLDAMKVAGIQVLTHELVHNGSPSAEAAVSNDVARATSYAMDVAFIDPSNAGVADIRPASVTSQGAVYQAQGSTTALIAADLERLSAYVAGGDSDLLSAYWIMHPSTIAHLAFARDTQGGPAFPGVGIRGGSIGGIPILSSAACINENSPADKFIALVDASEVLLADDGRATVEIAKDAAVQMDSVPDDPTSASTVVVSLWQRDLVGIKATRYCNWKLRRSTGAATLVDVGY